MGREEEGGEERGERGRRGEEGERRGRERNA